MRRRRRRGESWPRRRGDASGALARFVVRDAILDHACVVVLGIPSDRRLHICGLLHACEEAPVVEDGHQLVRLVMLQLVAPRVLDKRELTCTCTVPTVLCQPIIRRVLIRNII